MHGAKSIGQKDEAWKLGGWEGESIGQKDEGGKVGR
jgi:hypothetical protein